MNKDDTGGFMRPSYTQSFVEVCVS